MKTSEAPGPLDPAEGTQGFEGRFGLIDSDHDRNLLQSSILDGMLESVTVFDDAGIILYTNPAAERLFGYGPGELLGRHITVQAAYPPEALDQLRKDGTWTGEWTNRRKNGAIFRSTTRISALDLDRGRSWVCLQSELSPEVELHHLASIVESSDDAIITKDLNGIITSWNRGAENIFGYTAEEVLGKPVSILAPPHRPDEMPEILARLKRGELIHHYETERRTKDGRIIAVSLTVSPLRDASGEVVGASKIARDITESNRLRGELAAREFEYANLLANLPDVITRVDRDLRIRFVSQAVRKLEGFPPERYMAKTIVEAGFPFDLVDPLTRTLNHVLSSGEQQTIEFDLPNRHGRIRHYLTICLPDRLAGEIIGVLMISRDITEQKQAEQAQLSVERELMLLVEASSALIASPRSGEVLRTLLNLALRFVSADAYGVWRRDGEDWSLVASEGLSQPFTMDTIRGGMANPIYETVVFEDVFTSRPLSNRLRAYQSEGIRSMMIVPLWIEGAFSGTVVFYWRQKRASSAADIRIASALGNLAASALGTADLYEEETRSRLRAETSERRSKFLARAGAVLSSSLDFNATLNNVAKLAVPDFADWCSADVVNERGEIERVAVFHGDPAMIAVAEEYRTKFPPREEDVPRTVIRTGKSFLLPSITDEMIEKGARSEEHLEMLRKLQLRSLIIAPMLAGSESLGAITFVSSRCDRRYDERDLETAEELARRAATAISHARLYAHVRESEERLRLAITAAKLGVWENDHTTSVLTCSDQCKRHHGFSPEEDLTYELLRERVHPDDRTRWREEVEEAIAKRTPFEVEFRVILPDHSEKWVLAYGQPIFSAEGEVLGTVGVTMDVTENRTLLQREQEARRTAELLNGLGPVLLSELDPWQLAHRVVAAASQLVGAQFGILHYRWNEGEPASLYSLFGVDEAAFKALSGPDRERLKTIWATYSHATRTADFAGDDSPFSGIAGLPVRSLIAAPVRSRAGDILGALIFGQAQPGMFTWSHEDILAGIAAQASIALENAWLFEGARVAQEALRKSNEELRRANEDLNQFAYSASHDLQEPLRMVAIYSQMLGRRYETSFDEKGREYLRFTLQGAQRMEMLVKDLLAYTQAGSASGGEIESIDANAVLRQALQHLQNTIEENNASVTAGDLPRVRIQEVHLLQLLQNLVGNAIKYRRAGEQPRIAVEHIRLPDDMIEFRVTDNGIGIPAQYQKQVFGLFKRLHPGDKYPGTGIGLAICQRIVERYGGRIWVESEESLGSTFHFTLPAEA